MKIDVTQEILDFENRAIQDVVVCDACAAAGKQTILSQKPLTLRSILTTSLANAHRNDEDRIENTLKRYDLAMTIQKHDVFECDEARVKELKTRVNLMNRSALVVGRVCELLDQGGANDEKNLQPEPRVPDSTD